MVYSYKGDGKMKNKKELLLIVFFILLQTIIYIFVGSHKAYLHIDEAYSFGLTNYDKIDIESNQDFFNTWHSKEYYEDYLAVQEKDKGNYIPVYENQKNDVHPPLYYLLLRMCMEFTNGHVSIWPGIILNIILYAFITVFMYFILKKLFHDTNSLNMKALVLAFMSSIILASLSNVINIRMYALSTLNILITTFLHIKLLENEKIHVKLLIMIGASVLLGILTHYYYLFYIAILYVVFLIKYLKEKQVKSLLYYSLTMIIAGILSLIIFPYSISHMFFGYRGQGVMSNLTNIHEIIPSMFSQIYTLNYYSFNGLLPVILLIIAILLVINKIRKKYFLKLTMKEKQILKILCIPTIFFFVITSIVSPWKVLRYIVPVCGLLFVLAIYCIYVLLKNGFTEKIANICVAILLCIILVAPIPLHLKPELLYNDRKEIVQHINGELNLPTMYVFNSQTGGFLDDIFIFSKINDSFIAKDMDCTSSTIQTIFENKDISKGILVFINDGQNNDTIIDTVKSSLHFTNCDHLQKLSCCQVYHIY